LVELRRVVAESHELEQELRRVPLGQVCELVDHEGVEASLDRREQERPHQLEIGVLDHRSQRARADVARRPLDHSIRRHRAAIS
jgi:hypothetical protein